VINQEAARAPMIEAVPLGPLLDRFRASGLKLGVATNDGEAPARAHLSLAGVVDRFDFIAGYDSGHGAKPGPGMCLGFAAALRLDPARVVMVGDSRHDLEAGRAAGMQVVAVLTGLAEEGELAPHADAVLPDIGHLPAWLGR
jgi:phosphoglycolate phosphatase